MRAEELEDDLELLGVGGRRVRDLAGLLELDALVHDERGVATVVEDHVRAATVGPAQRLLGAPPVLLERLALPGEHRDAAPRRSPRRRGPGSRRCCSDAQRTSAPSVDERLDEHRGLDRHVQRAGDAGAGERLATRRTCSRSAMRPGISCSASSISLRPNSASERSATLKSPASSDDGAWNGRGHAATP